jgi:hypothetical protein
METEIQQRPEKCKNCRWWEEFGKSSDNQPLGRCRVRSPRLAVGQVMPVRDVGQVALEALWPWTDDKDWCGEFQPK